MAISITHPLSIGTKVQYLSPRCPCSGKRFAVVTGTIKSVGKTKDGKTYYVIIGDRKNIPQDGVIRVLSSK